MLPAALLAKDFNDLIADLCDHHMPHVTALGAKGFDICAYCGTHARVHSTTLAC